MADGSFEAAGLVPMTPAAATEKALRHAFGQFATGVTIVTAEGPDGPMGMTANSFSSVSLAPPLVMWCPARASSRYPVFAGARHFAIHVLAAEQEDLALRLARSGTDFGGIALDRNPAGVPLLPDCLARFTCRTHALHEAGDHMIVLGHVEEVATRPGNPLVFCQSRFGAFDKAL